MNIIPECHKKVDITKLLFIFLHIGQFFRLMYVSQLLYDLTLLAHVHSLPVNSCLLVLSCDMKVLIQNQDQDTRKYCLNTGRFFLDL